MSVTQTDWADQNSSASNNANAPDLLGLLWRRKWIVALFVALMLPLGYLFFLKQDPVYESAAQVLLIKHESSAKLPLENAEGQLRHEDALSTHIIILRSTKTIEQAVAKGKLTELPSVRSAMDQGLDPVKVIASGLNVSRAGGRELQDPNVMQLTYQCGNPEDCMTILNAIIVAYQDYQGDTYQALSDRTVQQIAHAKDVLEEQLAKKEAEYREFRREAPLLIKGNDGKNISIHENRLFEIERSRSELSSKIIQLKIHHETLQTALTENKNSLALLEILLDKPLSNSATKLVENTLPVDKAFSEEGLRNTFEKDLYNAVLEAKILSEDFGVDHPKMIAAKKKVELAKEQLSRVYENHESQWEQQLQKLEERATIAADKKAEIAREEIVPAYLESLKQELKISEERLAEYNTLFNQEQELAKQLSDYILKDEDSRKDIARTQTLFDEAVNGFEKITLSAGNIGGVKVDVIDRPALGKQVAPRLMVIMALFGMGGLVLGGGVAYLVELADRSFRSPDDVRAHLGLPIVGHVPLIDEKLAKKSVRNHAVNSLDPSLVTFYQPRSRAAEAYRAIRTSLYFSSRAGNLKVIQVTSPEPGDGKTTTASNLAISIADSGKSVLLIEADFRRPRVHHEFGLKNQIGVSSVIAGEAELSDGIHATPVKNLYVMPCGVRPDNPAELLMSPSFEHLIEITRTQYDFIIVDTPPILAVTDASIVAPRVDAVLLVISLNRRTREHATRARDVLASIGANIAGVVVNRFQQTQGYGYSAYRPGYGYGYGYGDHSYYDDEPVAGKAKRNIPAPKSHTNGKHEPVTK